MRTISPPRTSHSASSQLCRRRSQPPLLALVISIDLVHVLTGSVLQIGGFDDGDDEVVGRSDVVDEWALFVLD